uniref:Clathrin/coatomer adaptor adaptin-like N-terminal domain-containing protein n=1 Tax=Peronospora matthiolae TaxID=2874970 RepID=A0AAV1VMN1_9STRA
MTNPVNVEFISDKLTQFLREATDVFLRTELVSRITQCAERYAPSNAWYIQTMTNVFELGGDLVRSEVAHNLLRLIAEGSGEDEDQDMELRRDAVDTYLELLERPVLPDILVCTMSWVLGEYGYLSDAMELEEICERLVELVDRPFSQEDTTHGYVLSAVTKITARMGHTIDVADAMMKKYKNIFPEDASCEDIEVDPNLSFLTSFVEKAVAQGASLYDPPEDSDDDDESYGHRRNGGESNRLNFEAYKKPEFPYPTKLPLADQQGAFGVNKWGSNNVPGGAPGLGSSGGADPTGGFGAGKRGVVKNVSRHERQLMVNADSI